MCMFIKHVTGIFMGYVFIMCDRNVCIKLNQSEEVVRNSIPHDTIAEDIERDCIIIRHLPEMAFKKMDYKVNKRGGPLAWSLRWW